MPILIEPGRLILEACGFRMTARLRSDGWQVDGYPGRRFSQAAAITALTLEERVVAGYGPDDPHVRGRLAELGLTWEEFTGHGGRGPLGARQHRSKEEVARDG